MRRSRGVRVPIGLMVFAGVAVVAPAIAGIRDNLYGVTAVGPTEAWAVGNFGSIYHTRNGGRTWSTARSGTDRPLFSIDFGTARTGWIVGKSALILHTTDAGATWTPQKTPIPPDKHLFKVEALDDTTAWAVGDWGAITVTRDGGATWQDRSLGVLAVDRTEDPGRVLTTITDDVILYDVAFADPLHGYIVGEFGTVLATTDGGTTWRRCETGTEKTLFGVGVVSPERGWAVGMDGLVLRTVDGGHTWARQHGRGEDEALDDVGFMETLKNPGLYAVQVEGRTGVIVGDNGVLLTSADGGENWSQLQLSAKERLTWMRDVSLASATAGFLVGANGFTAVVSAEGIRLPGGTPVTTTN